MNEVYAATAQDSQLLSVAATGDRGWSQSARRHGCTIRIGLTL